MPDIYSVLGWNTDDHETPLFLSEDASAELRNLTDVFLMENTYLEKMAFERVPPLLIWHMVSKIPLHVLYGAGKHLATPVCIAHVHERGHDTNLQKGGNGKPIRGAKPPTDSNNR